MQVQLQEICKPLSRVSIDVTIPGTVDGSKVCDLAFLDKVIAAQQLEWGTNGWAAAHSAMYEKVSQGMEDLKVEQYLRILQAAAEEALAADRVLKLERFENLRDLLCDTLLPALVNSAVAECRPVLDDMVARMFEGLCGQTCPVSVFTALSHRLQGRLAQVIYAFLTGISSMGQVPAGFALEELDSSITARSAFQTDLEKLQMTAQQITQLPGVKLTNSSTVLDDMKSISKARIEQALANKGSEEQAARLFCFKWPLAASKAVTGAGAADSIFDRYAPARQVWMTIE